MPEWYLIIAALAGLGALGILWHPLLVALALCGFAVGLSVLQAIHGARLATFHTVRAGYESGIRQRILTAFLHLAQPLARLIGRMRLGLTAWRLRGAEGFRLPKNRSTAVWSTVWRAPEERYSELVRTLRDSGAILYCGGEYDRWDVDVLGGMFGSTRLLLAVEDHGAGTQLVRTRSWPRFRPMGVVFAVPLASLTMLAALAGSTYVAVVIAAALGWLLWTAFLQAGQATAQVLRAIGSSA
jgi:hypothetical protein